MKPKQIGENKLPTLVLICCPLQSAGFGLGWATQTSSKCLIMTPNFTFNSWRQSQFSSDGICSIWTVIKLFQLIIQKNHNKAHLEAFPKLGRWLERFECLSLSLNLLNERWFTIKLRTCEHSQVWKVSVWM